MLGRSRFHPSSLDLGRAVLAHPYFKGGPNRASDSLSGETSFNVLFSHRLRQTSSWEVLWEKGTFPFCRN